MSAVFACPDFEPHEKLVMLALADHADELHECFPSVARLARMTGMSDRGVRKVIRRLEDRGFIVTKANAGRKGSNRFSLRLPVALAGVTPEPGSPLNGVPPEPGSAYPGTRFTPTPERGSPKPSLNHQEPCARGKGRAVGGKRTGQERQAPAPASGREDVLRLFAEKISQGRHVPASALTQAQIREMVRKSMVSEVALREAGFAV